MNHSRPAYAMPPKGLAAPPLSLVERADRLVPVRHLISARLGFARRFDDAVARLSVEGGSALSPSAGALYFGDQLCLEIDPRRLTHRLGDDLFDGRTVQRADQRFLDGSNWEGAVFPLKETPVHGEMLEICRTRNDFRTTSRYRWVAKQIEQGHSVARSGIRLDTLAKLDGYFLYYLGLVESIERDGMLPRRRLGLGHRTGQTHRATRTIWRDLIERDIGVAVDADGGLLRHTCGRHRLAAAIGLGLERIPVEVRMVHVDWLSAQARRLDMTPARALPVALAEIAGAQIAGPQIAGTERVLPVGAA